MTRVFPDVPVSQKPTEVRMGKGSTSEYWACRINQEEYYLNENMSQ